MTECLECGAPAEIQESHQHDGVDFDGSDVVFWLDRILCAAGHTYCLVDESRTERLGAGEMFA